MLCMICADALMVFNAVGALTRNSSLHAHLLCACGGDLFWQGLSSDKVSCECGPDVRVDLLHGELAHTVPA